jgi:protein-tyrosine phosphatase
MNPSSPVPSSPVPSALDGVWNLRDLGAHPVTSGGHTRSGRVFRGGTLWFATAQDCRVLGDLGFDTVIDLRLPQEELSEEDWLCELLDTRYHHLQITVLDDPSPIALVHPGGADHYVRLLEHNAARYVKALAIISDPDNHPILFHCAAGHDRTGVLAALVLACLEVDDAAIVADYLDSAAHVPAIVAAYRDHRLYGAASAEAGRRSIDAAVMEQFLDLMGGGDGLTKWALANGLAEASLSRMRAALIER